jgi:hypothetical protein
MDDLVPKAELPQSELAELQAGVESLRSLFFSLLVLVVIISGTLNIFLLRQWRTASKDLDLARTQAAPLISEYQKTGPAMDNFVRQIAEYGRTHPDFAPIMAKYGIKPTIAVGTPSATSTPPAAATPVPKK